MPNRFATETASKPNPRGVRTSEFWLAVATLALGIGMTYLDTQNAPWAVTAAGIVGAAYAFARGLAKLERSRDPQATAERITARED